MTTNVGFRIYQSINRPDQALVEKFKGIPSSTINDQMNRLYCMSAAISPLNKVASMVGTAFTVKLPIGDNLMFHKALDMAQPGDVLIIDGAGAMDRSLAGEIMITYAAKRGIAGIVVDGAMRDLDGIKRCPMPIYAKGITPQGPYKNGPGEIGVPVSCGGIVVFPGDIIVGDSDGIVVIRPDDALVVLESAQRKLASETVKLSRYTNQGLDTAEHAARIEKAITAKGVYYAD